MWSRSGELFYLNQNSDALMGTTVRMQATGMPEFGVPTRVLDTTRYFNFGIRGAYDVSADGQRFLVIKPETTIDQSATAAHIVVVLHPFGDRLARSR